MKTNTLFIAALAAVTLFSGSNPARASDRDYCREYTREVYTGGVRQEAYGTACARPDGSWEIVAENLGLPVNFSRVINYYEPRPQRVVYARHTSPVLLSNFFWIGNSRPHHYDYDWRRNRDRHNDRNRDRDRDRYHDRDRDDHHRSHR